MLAYVYDGSQDKLSILRGMFTIPDDVILIKSSSDEQFSTITLLGDGANTVAKGDMIKIESVLYNGWAFIMEPNITNRHDVVETTIALETDGLISEGFNWGGNLTKADMFTFLYNNYDMLYKTWHPHRIKASDKTTFSGYITFTDFDLPMAQMFRQLFRQGIRVDIYVDINKNLCFKPHRVHAENTVMFDINLDGVVSYEHEASNQSYNSLRVFVEDGNGNNAYYGTWFLTKDGGVVWNPSTEAAVRSIQKPIQSRIEIYTNDVTANDIANNSKNKLLTDQYQNSLSITFNKEWVYYDELIKFKDNIFKNLGSRGYVTITNGVRLIANIVGIEVYRELITVHFNSSANKQPITKLKNQLTAQLAKGVVGKVTPLVR